ncbi:MAG: hypothetical protein K6B28_07540 [Lachnospiraceae bacterium]|nr:hypothetical protein [Lachnospiraceae bacterium]
MMNNKTRNIITFSLLAVSLILIGLGVKTGEYEAVLNKAINVCMECIGIG